MIKESKSNRTRQVQFRMDPDKVKRLLAAIAYDDNMHSMTDLFNKAADEYWKETEKIAMANKIIYRTEDEVRDSAKIQLGFDKIEANVKQGTGQITTFNQLGFKGVIDKPDGWYLPDDCSIPAIILETKSEAEDISLQKWADELIKNCDIVSRKYVSYQNISSEKEIQNKRSQNSK